MPVVLWVFTGLSRRGAINNNVETAERASRSVFLNPGAQQFSAGVDSGVRRLPLEHRLGLDQSLFCLGWDIILTS